MLIEKQPDGILLQDWISDPSVLQLSRGLRSLTRPPWLVKEQKLPTSTLPAMLCLKTSTPSTSATTSSVSYTL